ncbi:MAG: DNA/RNA non-specific endonuclease [Bacteroidales bacterium]|nr:DNA/RNA non-specific endonuclease [Bacteroidales bacterium]
MKTIAKIRAFLLPAVSVMMMSAVVACSTGKDELTGNGYGSSSNFRLILRTSPLPVDSYKQILSFDAEGSWQLNTSADWLLLAPVGGAEPNSDEAAAGSQTLSGIGGTPVLLISLANPDENTRSGEITIKSGSKTASLQVSQLGTSSGQIDTGGKPSLSAGWMELPETNAEDGLDAYTVRFTDNSRNYTFYWDYNTFVSNWVAYPLNTALIGDYIARTNAWAYCPLLPAHKQTNISRAYTDASGSYCGYDRGHQLPSADRLGSFARNAQTFYGVNMTPQDDKFNSNIWATVEGRVRALATKTYTDTLYVLTGCVTTGATEFVYDASGNHITIPKAYFKAVLLHEKSSSDIYASTGHYAASAVWFDHAEYSQPGKYNEPLTNDLAISIKDLEERLGYKLFVNLDAAVGAETAETIKTTIIPWLQ